MTARVAAIIDQIKTEGDVALFALTAQYDQVSLSELEVTPEEWVAAKENITSTELAAIEFAIAQIATYHSQQLPRVQVVETIAGVRCERLVRPIERVGLYIPGGSAPLVSSVLMQAIPARIADCPMRILATPPNKAGKIDPRILVAAALCGIERVFKMGGAQAIAAMAYGTESVPKVDKIFGPGNAWVTQAKMWVSQDVNGASIDMPAGPSELLVIADDAANPEFVAADLLSQAEHGPDSQVLLIALSQDFAVRVKTAVEAQLQALTRREIAEKSLQHSRFIVVDDVLSAIEVSNEYAPEHLILQVQDADTYVPHVTHAGAVFIGPWTPETVGDYVTGSNHVLPTSGYARTWSGLSVLDFTKFISVQHVTREGLQNIGPYAETLATMEGLDGHKNAVSMRLKHGQ
jgi:histidinol dehydrogenase